MAPPILIPPERMNPSCSTIGRTYRAQPRPRGHHNAVWPLTSGATTVRVNGVTRDVVIELAGKAGYEVQESILNRYDVYTADEAFFTGSASELVAIRQVDGRVIGTGKAGPVTRDLRARFQAFVRS